MAARRRRGWVVGAGAGEVDGEAVASDEACRIDLPAEVAQRWRV